MWGLNEKKIFGSLQVAATFVFFIVYVETNSQSRVEKMYDYNFFYKGQTFLLNNKSPKTADLSENILYFSIACKMPGEFQTNTSKWQ